VNHKTIEDFRGCYENISEVYFDGDNTVSETARYLGPNVFESFVLALVGHLKYSIFLSSIVIKTTCKGFNLSKLFFLKSTHLGARCRKPEIENVGLEMSKLAFWFCISATRKR